MNRRIDLGVGATKMVTMNSESKTFFSILSIIRSIIIIIHNNKHNNNFVILLHTICSQILLVIFSQQCQVLCSALAYTSPTTNVYYFDSPFCYIGSQSGDNILYHITTNVTITTIKWVLLARQTSGGWFNPNEWSTTGVGKFAILDKIEQFRCDFFQFTQILKF